MDEDDIRSMKEAWENEARELYNFLQQYNNIGVHEQTEDKFVRGYVTSRLIDYAHTLEFD